ncbi:MAG: toprim domain-containing protein [Rikenellaceae bacterium]
MTDVKNISIKEYLASRGITPKRETTHSGYYLSPLRSETTPSFHVSYDKNLWHDFGADEGGSIIDLVMQLDNCSVAEAYRKLEGSDTLVPIEQPAQIYKPKESPIKIVDVLPLRHPKLIEYITKDRAIDLEVAKRYCREVHYTLNGKHRFAVGFGNDADGWELSAPRGFKLSTSPKMPSTIYGSCDDTLIFEGFMDMLAYITFFQGFAPVENIIVLNSVVNLPKVAEFLKGQQSVFCLLDNDEAGRKALAQVKEYNGRVTDMSHLYKDFNDVNESLQHFKRSQEQEAKEEVKPTQQPKQKFRF